MDDLRRGRRACKENAWADAFEALSRADRRAPLDPADLERLALSAYLTCRDEHFIDAFGRAHAAYIEAGDIARAIRCAFWIGLTLLFRGEAGRGTGWLSGAQRLIERENLDCAERGYLLLPNVEQLLGSEDFDQAFALAGEAVRIGELFDDNELIACARHLQGRVAIGQGRVDEGLALLDEAMVLVTSGNMFPIMAGLIYCSVVAACQQVYAFARAREWTVALSDWCAKQPQMVAFTDTCLVHRSEIMTLHGAWSEAIEEARLAGSPQTEAMESPPPPAAFYQQAEVHRLRGDFSLAEDGYREASRLGMEPQPGLALLRMAQGDTETAVQAIRRVVEAAAPGLQRARLLPAFVEIMLAAGNADRARHASEELDAVARHHDSEALKAMAAHARGLVELADGKAQAALASLRIAFDAWQQVDAPYETARVRAAACLACGELGDSEGAELEMHAAQAAFRRLGAGPDLQRLAGLSGATTRDHPHGLTRREMQVLGHVASGKSNKAIAAELCLSERTVERHVSNIFDKLDVRSRAAATAFAYEHDLVRDAGD